MVTHPAFVRAIPKFRAAFNEQEPDDEENADILKSRNWESRKQKSNTVEAG
jgi:hypothetical protein